MASIEIGAAAQGRVDQTQIAVLYAGDIELARPQFASSARHLALVPITDVIGAFGGRSVAAGIDAAVIDCAAPSVNAAQIVLQLRAIRPSIPILLLIDPGIESGASLALSLQIDDYTIKSPGWLARLPIRLQIVVNRHRRIQQLETAGRTEQRVKTAIERAPVCLARVLDDGSVAAMNDAARSMLAVISSEDVLKKPLAAFVGAVNHQPLGEFISTVCGGEARSIELPIVPKEGDERIAELRGVALPQDPDGRSSAIIAMRDLSDRRRLEASVVDVSTGDLAAERGANGRLSGEIAELRQRLAEAEHQQQAFIRDRDAHQQAAELAASESARLTMLLETERLATSADREKQLGRVGELERLLREHGTHTNALDQERLKCQAAEGRLSELEQRVRDDSGAVATLRERCDALESERQRLIAKIAAYDAERTRVTALSQEWESLRTTLEEQRGPLEEERRTREAAESRLSELERRHVDKCAELESRLRAAKVEFDELTLWASARATRMGEGLS